MSGYVLYRVSYRKSGKNILVTKTPLQTFGDKGQAIQARDRLIERNGGAGAMYAIEPIEGHEPPKPFRVTEGPGYDPN